MADLNKALPKLREEKRKGRMRALESAREVLAKSEADVAALKRRVKELERETQ
jgi:polyhydroxyalkanoate synthesis regulator phasin